MYEMQEFKNGPLSAHVRTLLIEGVVWFVLMDVARVFGYRDAGRVLHLLRPSQYVQADEPIKQALGVRGKPPYLVSEGGFYRLALQSSKEEAAPFQEWVEDEVLVTIRKASSVGIDVLNDAKKEYERRIQALETRNDHMELEANLTEQSARTKHEQVWEAYYGKKEALEKAQDMLRRGGVPEEHIPDWRG